MGRKHTRVIDTYNLCKENFFDPAGQTQAVKDIVPYILGQAWYVGEVHPYGYTSGELWLKNFHGEFSVGRNSTENWSRWAWVDQELKQQMTTRR